jgi:hypothetical protein
MVRSWIEHVQVWEVATGEPVARLNAGDCGQVVFTPDNRRLVTAGVDGLRVWDVATVGELARRQGIPHFRGSYGASFASSLAVAPDGQTAATGHIDSTILLWDLRHDRPAAARPPSGGPDVQSLWSDLAGRDAARAHIAIYRLADNPVAALGILRERLRPAAPVELARWAALRRDLDSDRFATRQSATTELLQLGDIAEPKLREWLKEPASPESRKRIEVLLAQLPGTVPPPEQLRELRAIRVLELIGGPQAREMLESIAKGDAAARLTREAAGGLGRLK